MAALLHERPTRREREVNWGDKTRLTGNEKKTLAWVSVDESRAVVVYATATLSGQGSDGFAVVANIEWGHGGASVDQDFPIVHRLRVPLAASTVKVSGRILDADGNAPPATVVAEVSVVIAPGQDSENLRNTRWLSARGALGILAEGPQRVLQVEGFNAGGTGTWVMLIDKVGAENGDVPAMVRPARAGQTFAMQRFDTQAFRNGVSWAASSTPFALTKDPNASLRIDVEFLL